MEPFSAVGGQVLDSALQVGMQVYQQKMAEKAARKKRQQEMQDLGYQELQAAWGDQPNLERQSLGQMLNGFSQILL